jgi:hypothetical protein
MDARETSWGCSARSRANRPPADGFMQDVASRIKFDAETRPHAERRRAQLTTDGLYWYMDAVDHAFAADMVYAMLQKQYSGSPVDKERGCALQPREDHERDTEVIRRQLEFATHQHELH